MKKIAFLLAFILCLGAAAGFAAELKPANVVGTWYSNTATGSYGEVVLLDPVQLDLNRDGSMTLTYKDETIQGTWSLSGDKESVHVKAESGDVLFIEQDEEGGLWINIKMFKGQFSSIYLNCALSREVTPFSCGEPVAAEEEDAFYGTWKAAYRIYDEMPGVLVVLPEDTAALTVEFAQATMEEADQDPVTVMTNFTDGKLVSPDGDSLTLTDKDMMIVIDARDLLIEAVYDTYVFVRVAEEAAE
ncbi:MAG: hypothetical protein IKI84_04630 [Clostridia bacterium]|nr:hypothetical protein [Clostridia bacterium]